MRCGPGSRFENISFSNLVMKNVTGPISIGLGPQPRRAPAQPAPNASESNTQPARTDQTPGIVRNISFHGIRATVARPVQLPDVPFTSGYNPGEVFSCITLNGMGQGFLENISFNDVHVTFPGGGTAEQAAVRDVPKVAGEYYEIGVPPAYGMYARNVRGLTLDDVRFEVTAPELRPALVFDHVADATVDGFSAQGTKAAESLLRFIDTRDILLSAARVLTPAAVFLRVEGASSERITIDGGDWSKATAPLSFSVRPSLEEDTSESLTGAALAGRPSKVSFASTLAMATPPVRLAAP